MSKPFDVRVANLIKKKLVDYLNFRIKPENENDKEQRWLSNFVDDRESFVFQLYRDIKINLYKDSLLCKFIYNSFEESELKFLRKFLKKGDSFIDIGANIGLFTLHASMIVGNEGCVYSFEPTPRTFDRLKENIDLNLCQNVTAENIGLSDKSGIMSFNTSVLGYDAWNSFADLNEIGDVITIDVRVIMLDQYLSEKKLVNIDFVKIDVEGWELFVLKGANNLLSSERAPVLMIEFTENNAFAAGYYCGELYDYVKSFGYEWYSYNSETNTLEPQIKKLHYLYENLIAIKDYNLVVERINTENE